MRQPTFACDALEIRWKSSADFWVVPRPHTAKAGNFIGLVDRWIDFWFYARGLALDGAGLTEQLRSTATATLLEYLAILEAQQRSLDRNAGEPFMNIAVDTGAITVERLREKIGARPLRALAQA